MAIKDKALEYCSKKGLYTLSEAEKKLLCKNVFVELSKIPNDYNKNKQLLSKLRGE